MMSSNLIRKLPAGMICALVVIFMYAGVSRSQFLDIEEESAKPVEEAKPEPVKERKLPLYVARGIKAEPVPNIKGAIKITWDIDPATDEDFIIGRATEVPFSKERASLWTTLLSARWEVLQKCILLWPVKSISSSSIWKLASPLKRFVWPTNCLNLKKRNHPTTP